MGIKLLFLSWVRVRERESELTASRGSWRDYSSFTRVSFSVLSLSCSHSFLE